MEKPDFYDKEKAQLREDFFRNKTLTLSSINELFFKIIYEEVPVGAKILDIGTGNAFVLEQLVKRFPSRYNGLYGVDISPEMLEKAKERTCGLDVQLVLGDNMDLPFESGFFDAVTAKNVTNFSESEVYRVLKSPGKFLFREYGPSKGVKEIANLFRGRLIRARDPSYYTQRLESVGFRNISLREFDVKRECSFEELLQIIQMFPFLDQVREEDRAKIRDYFGLREKMPITSDQIVIIGEKENGRI